MQTMAVISFATYARLQLQVWLRGPVQNKSAFCAVFITFCHGELNPMQQQTDEHVMTTSAFLTIAGHILLVTFAHAIYLSIKNNHPPCISISKIRCALRTV